jgi:uncharacterized membrane protein
MAAFNMLECALMARTAAFWAAIACRASSKLLAKAGIKFKKNTGMDKCWQVIESGL